MGQIHQETPVAAQKAGAVDLLLQLRHTPAGADRFPLQMDVGGVPLDFDKADILQAHLHLLPLRADFQRAQALPPLVDAPVQHIEYGLPVHRFYQIIQNTQVIAHQPVYLAGGDEGNLTALVQHPQAASCFHAGQPRHIDIQQDQVPAVPPPAAEELLPAGGLLHPQAVSALLSVCLHKAAQLGPLLRQIITNYYR